MLDSKEGHIPLRSQTHDSGHLVEEEEVDFLTKGLSAAASWLNSTSREMVGGDGRQNMIWTHKQSWYFNLMWIIRVVIIGHTRIASAGPVPSTRAKRKTKDVI